MKTFLLFAIVLIFENTFSQDSTIKEWRFQKKVTTWYKWQNAGYDAEVSMPGVIGNLRNWGTQLPVNFQCLTDNPLMHGAAYLALKTQTDYKNKVSLFADVYGEHRGASYGLFNQANTSIYPIIRLQAKDTFRIFSKNLVLRGKAGQFIDERMDEGLMVYNIDLQGMQVQAQFNNFCFQYTLYGDLSNGIGLNIDDLEAYSLSKTFKNQLAVGFSYVMAMPGYSPLKNNYSFNLFASRPIKRGGIYSQLAMRPYDSESSSSLFKETGSKMAFVLGMNKGGSSKNLVYTVDASIRYYGFTYNYSHTDAHFRYRENASNQIEMYANTVGDYLYPLRKFETPFSQWAVYTEYWSGYNVATAIVRGNFNYRFAKKFATNLDYDFNYIYAVDAQHKGYNSLWLYPFFNAALVYLPVEKLQLKGGFTNKAMNLDLSYPTHYLLKVPCFEISLAGEF